LPQGVEKEDIQAVVENGRLRLSLKKSPPKHIALEHQKKHKKLKDSKMHESIKVTDQKTESDESANEEKDNEAGKEKEKRSYIDVN